MKIELSKLVMKCTKDHPVEMNELMQLQKMVVPKKTETKCLLACAYKLEGIVSGNKIYCLQIIPYNFFFHFNTKNVQLLLHLVRIYYPEDVRIDK